jgi:hypothetical protein
MRIVIVGSGKTAGQRPRWPRARPHGACPDRRRRERGRASADGRAAAGVTSRWSLPAGGSGCERDPARPRECWWCAERPGEAERAEVTVLVERSVGRCSRGELFGRRAPFRPPAGCAGAGGRPEFDAFILEEHHAARRAVGHCPGAPRPGGGADPARSSHHPIRAGATPGTHLLAYDGSYERIALSHVARSRSGFAAGALAAAEWLPATEAPGSRTCCPENG